MNIASFKSGILTQRYHYQSFEPSAVNHPWFWESASINTLLESSNQALGALNAFSLIVPDMSIFIRMHVLKEAQTSSKIEGTHTGMEEALMGEQHIAPEKRDDWREVQNYIAAMNFAVNRLKDLPLSCRLLRETHAVLMRGVRGEHKRPGEFRLSQNWIGGSNLKDAVFIPPHYESVAALMSDLEGFWHNNAIEVPHLIRVGISHYQFETIHPFLDGNGRIGRLMIPLYLIGHGLLLQPSLYLSAYFEKHRASYYDALMRVRTAHDLEHWLKFFLNGVYESAQMAIRVFQGVLALRQRHESALMLLGKKGKNGYRALQYLYTQPIISAEQLEKTLGVSRPTAQSTINTLVDQGILTENSPAQRGRLYVFKAYLDLFTQS